MTIPKRSLYLAQVMRIKRHQMQRLARMYARILLNEKPRSKEERSCTDQAWVYSLLVLVTIIRLMRVVLPWICLLISKPLGKFIIASSKCSPQYWSQPVNPMVAWKVTVRNARTEGSSGVKGAACKENTCNYEVSSV